MHDVPQYSAHGNGLVSILCRDISENQLLTLIPHSQRLSMCTYVIDKMGTSIITCMGSMSVCSWHLLLIACQLLNRLGVI